MQQVVGLAAVPHATAAPWNEPVQAAGSETEQVVPLQQAPGCGHGVGVHGEPAPPKAPPELEQSAAVRLWHWPWKSQHEPMVVTTERSMVPGPPAPFLPPMRTV